MYYDFTGRPEIARRVKQITITSIERGIPKPDFIKSPAVEVVKLETNIGTLYRTSIGFQDIALYNDKGEMLFNYEDFEELQEAWKSVL